MTMPPAPLAYKGLLSIPYICKPFPPSYSFDDFTVPTVWVDTAHLVAYMLVGLPEGGAWWATLGGIPGQIDTITTPDGNVVQPDADNVNFLNGIGMNITGTTPNITFNVVGGGLAWHDVNGTTQQAATNNGYIPDNGSLVTITLPTTANLGDMISILGKGAGGWQLAQNTGQTVYFGRTNTTAGTGGSLASTNAGDAITLVCITPNTTFRLLNSIGDITVV